MYACSFKCRYGVDKKNESVQTPVPFDDAARSIYRVCIFSSALLRKTGGFLEEYRLIEDMTYWPYIAKKGIDFDFAKIIMVKYALSGVSNGGEHHCEFEKDRREIIRKYYISNMETDSLAGWLKKNERKREADYLDQIDENPSALTRIKYFDVLWILFIRNLKYLLWGRRI